MIEHPFDIFRPYADRVRVRLYDRADDIRSPDDVRRLESLPLADPEETHGNLTVHVEGPGTVKIADGLVTDVPGLCLDCRTADCQSFAVYDPVRHAGGVLHAGWHGLVKDAISEFVNAMKREWESDPADFIVGIGPSLCLECSEFTDPTRELPTIDAKFFRGRLVDLRGIADDQWTKAGVKRENIERHPDCSKCDRKRWWTLRGGDRDELARGARNVLTFSLK